MMLEMESHTNTMKRKYEHEAFSQRGVARSMNRGFMRWMDCRVRNPTINKLERGEMDYRERKIF